MQKILFVVVIFFALSCSESKKQTVVAVHDYVSVNLDSLRNWMTGEFMPLIDSATSESEIQVSYLNGRKKYKKIEFAIEYFFPSSARGINGPPLPEIEAEEHTVLEPGGFQVMEEFIYVADSSKDNLKREARKLNSLLERVAVLWSSLQFRDDQVFDALKLECFRIMTLGVTGFDTPASFASISEVPVSLQSIQTILSFYDDNPGEIDSLLRQASAFAESNKDFNSFDRFTFIRKYMNSITPELLAVQKRLNIPLTPEVHAVKSSAGSLFDSAAFNLNYFTPDANSRLSDAKVELGKQLFFETRISKNNKVSCATCHQPGKAFTDGLVKSKNITGEKLLPRNTPTLLNAGLQKAQFYDMRSAFLEDQVRNVIENKDEIHGDLKDAVRTFLADTAYKKQFNVAFGRDVNERDIQVALAAYVRSLTSFNTRFDRVMRGNAYQMSEEEIQGFNLFMGKAKCGTCHFMPLFNGTVPPAFTFTESEVIGVPADPAGKKLDSDSGRYGVYQIDNFRHAFKTPTIRNINQTAPYMHNGVYQTLDEVMDFYNKGGGAGLGLKVDNQTLPFDSLSLSEKEKKLVIAFMGTLSDLQ